jgi:HTH-type transcriptional regulator/antitoxin HigA
MSKVEYEEIIAFHPGYYIREILDEAMMSQDELAKRLATSAKNVSEIINAKAELTDDMSYRLSMVFGTSIELWIGLTRTWQLKKMNILRRQREEREKKYLDQLDYGFWEELGVVKETENTSERMREMCRYLKIASLETLDKKDFLVQFKATGETDAIETVNANAWVQTAINIGSTIETKPFDLREFNRITNEVLHISYKEEVIPEQRLRKLLAECGIAFVMLPYLKHSEILGAVKWIGKNKAVLAVCNTMKSTDEFWSRLLHELGHIKQKRITKLIVLDKDGSVYSPDDARIEKEAENFVKAMLKTNNKA